jgi:uncharacterized OB-fold protein
MSQDHLPIADAESERFWAALADSVLLVSHCPACGENTYYPRAYCPRCWARTEWLECSGRGVVIATTVIRQHHLKPFRDRTPYNVAVVALEEGPQLLTRVLGVEPEAVSIGSEVRLAPVLEDGWWLPTFESADADQE